MKTVGEFLLAFGWNVWEFKHCPDFCSEEMIESGECWGGIAYCPGCGGFWKLDSDYTCTGEDQAIMTWCSERVSPVDVMKLEV